MARRLVIGISGASGSHLAYRLLQYLNTLDIETYVIVTNGAKRTWECEMKEDISVLKDVCTKLLDNTDIGACIASGSFKTEGMIIVPCSMKTIAGIASGYSDNLLLRAADVMIKEKRKLVLMFRENPMSPIHFKNLEILSNIYSIYLMPMVMTYYNHPQSIEDMEDSLIGKMLDPFEIEYDGYKRWK